MKLKRFLVIVCVLALLEGTVALFFQQPAQNVSASMIDTTPRINPAHTRTPTPTFTNTPESSWTPSFTPTGSHTPTDTATYTATVPTATDTSTATATFTSTPTGTLTSTATFTPTGTLTSTSTFTPTGTLTPTPTFTPTLPPELDFCVFAYSNNFEGTSPDMGKGWTNFKVDSTPKGQHFLGMYGNETASVTLLCAEEHEYVHVSFDLYIINSWDGNEDYALIGPDRWKFNVRGEDPIVDTTFANWSHKRQTYPENWLNTGDFPAHFGSVSVNALGYNFRGTPLDTVYHFSYTIKNSDPLFTLDFTGSGLQNLGDESWGIDNIVVETTTVDTPYYLPYVGK